MSRHSASLLVLTDSDRKATAAAQWVERFAAEAVQGQVEQWERLLTQAVWCIAACEPLAVTGCSEKGYGTITAHRWIISNVGNSAALAM